jgi:hypothetical protein
MITLHVFTEEASAKNVFQVLLPKIIPETVYFRIYPHQGKKDLEKALQKSLPSISRIPGSKILVTCDPFFLIIVNVIISLELHVRSSNHGF